MKLLLISAAIFGLLASAPDAWADKTSATKAVAEARAMIRSAERSGADALATAELKMARNLFNSAEASIAEKKWEDAEYAARKSQRDAELADIKAQAMKAEQSLAQLQEVVATLRNELERKAGAQQ